MNRNRVTALLLSAGIALTSLTGTVPAQAAAKKNMNLLKDTKKTVVSWENNVSGYVPNDAEVTPVIKYTVTIPRKEYSSKIDSQEDIFADGPVISADYSGERVNFTATEIRENAQGKYVLTGEKTNAEPNAYVSEPADTVVEYEMMVEADDTGTIDIDDVIEDLDGNGYVVTDMSEIDDEDDPNYGSVKYSLDPAVDTVTFPVKTYVLKKVSVKEKGKKKIYYRVTLPTNKYTKTVKKGQKLYVKVKDNDNGDLAIIKVNNVKKTKAKKIVVTGKLLKIS